MLADEEDSLRRVGGENFFRDLDATESGKAHVQKDQIGFERLSLLNRFRAICRFTDDLPLDGCLQRTPKVASPRLEVIDYEHARDHVHEFFSRPIQTTSDCVRKLVRKKILSNLITGRSTKPAGVRRVRSCHRPKRATYIDTVLDPVKFSSGEFKR